MQQLKNFFVVCRCGRSLLFNTIDQIRICPKCRESNQIGPATKKYLTEKYSPSTSTNLSEIESVVTSQEMVY
jgi:hypothetical protein